MILALTMLAAGAPAVLAEDEPDSFQIQGWSGGPRFEANGRAFSHCAVTTVLGGVSLTFALTVTDEFRIEIGADDWHLRPGGDYVATLMIDHHEPIQTIAAARSDKRMVVDVGADDEIMKALREGLFLRVLSEHIGISFSLTGSSQALLRLRACVTDNRGRVR
ncbi:MAG: hypothetical protein JO021_06315 [Alphaproteobacteria bacterium]|nr:hypothetical protein [Alphaproteobacteria bacterium]